MFKTPATMNKVIQNQKLGSIWPDNTFTVIWGKFHKNEQPDDVMAVLKLEEDLGKSALQI